MAGSKNPLWKENLGIQMEVRVSHLPDYVWCAHHTEVHDAIPDVYGTREDECYLGNWKDIYVGLDEPKERDKDERARWEEHTGRRPNPPQTVEMNELLRRGVEVEVPIPPPLRSPDVQRIADEILKAREVRRQKGDARE